MNKVSHVALSRVEGPCSECFAVVFYNEDNQIPEINSPDFKNARFVPVKQTDIFSSVSKQMFYWGFTAPKNGGYDKVQFVVAWDGDDSYSGRFDMSYGGLESGKSFWDNLFDSVKFYACEWRPDHFDDCCWDSHVARMEQNGNKAEALRMLRDNEFTQG